jgi:hypothetical protein
MFIFRLLAVSYSLLAFSLWFLYLFVPSVRRDLKPLLKCYRGRWLAGIHLPRVPLRYTLGYQHFATMWLNPGVAFVPSPFLCLNVFPSAPLKALRNFHIFTFPNFHIIFTLGLRSRTGSSSHLLLVPKSLSPQVFFRHLRRPSRPSPFYLRYSVSSLISIAGEIFS